MEPWIPITIAAAFFQNARSAVQRHLRVAAGTTASALARFIFAIPFAALYAGTLLLVHGGPPPDPGLGFFAYAMIGGVTQILGTVCLITAVSEGNFAVGTALSKTETVQAAIVAAVVLAEPAAPMTLLGILVSLAGVLLLIGPVRLGADLKLRPALAGLAAGTFFAVSAVCYRGAALALDPVDRVTAAGVTLAFVTIFQSVVMLAWMVPREPAALFALARAWRWGLAAGLTGMLASTGWFTAMALNSVPAVRALGQIELVFSLAASKWAFKEKIRPRELVGLVLLAAGLIAVIRA